MFCIACSVIPVDSEWVVECGTESHGPYMSNRMALRVAISEALELRRQGRRSRISVRNSAGGVKVEHCLCADYKKPPWRRIAIAHIQPLKLASSAIKKSPKYAQIVASIPEVGIVEPPVVARDHSEPGKYLLLDGHLRIDILTQECNPDSVCYGALGVSDGRAVGAGKWARARTP